jgi:hypothetical protein
LIGWPMDVLTAHTQSLSRRVLYGGRIFFGVCRQHIIFDPLQPYVFNATNCTVYSYGTGSYYGTLNCLTGPGFGTGYYIMVSVGGAVSNILQVGVSLRVPPWLDFYNLNPHHRSPIRSWVTANQSLCPSLGQELSMQVSAAVGAPFRRAHPSRYDSLVCRYPRPSAK